MSAESTTTDATVAALDDSTGRETFFRQRIDNVLAAMVAKRQSDMNVDAER